MIQIAQYISSRVYVKKRRRSGLRRGFLTCTIGEIDKSRCVSYFSTVPYHMFLKKEAFQPSDIHYEELPEQLLQKRKEQYIQQAIKLLEKEGMTVVPPSVA